MAFVNIFGLIGNVVKTHLTVSSSTAPTSAPAFADFTPPQSVLVNPFEEGHLLQTQQY